MIRRQMPVRMTQAQVDEVVAGVQQVLSAAVGKSVLLTLHTQNGVKETTRPTDDVRSYAPNGKRRFTLTLEVNPPYETQDGYTPCGCLWDGEMIVVTCAYHEGQNQRLMEALDK